jgi:antitoxin YefM
MAMQMSFTEARAHFANVCNRVRDNRETVLITRKGEPEVAVIAADELASLQETAYLLRSPKNAVRLLTALNRALARTAKPQTIQDIRRELGLGAEE